MVSGAPFTGRMRAFGFRPAHGCGPSTVTAMNEAAAIVVIGLLACAVRVSRMLINTSGGQPVFLTVAVCGRAKLASCVCGCPGKGMVVERLSVLQVLVLFAWWQDGSS